MKFIFDLLKPQFIIISIAILIATYLIFPISVNAQESKLRTLIVTGEGKEMIPTTITQVDLGVEIKGETSSEVQQQVAQKSTSVVDLLRSRNVQRLQTTGIRLQPNYDYNSENRRLIGYTGVNTVSFEIETAKLGDLLDKAVDAGATRIDRVSFVATDSAIASAQKKALQAAVEDGQSQAEAVLDTLNFSIQDIIKIQVNGTNMPQPLPRMQRTALDAASVDTPAIGGEQTVRASVTLEVSY